MTNHKKQTPEPGKETLKGQIPSGNKSGAAAEDDCRCKEVSGMKPSEMLRLVIGDLAFWRKAKRYK